jgi:hypothetical protein
MLTIYFYSAGTMYIFFFFLQLANNTFDIRTGFLSTVICILS